MPDTWVQANLLVNTIPYPGFFCKAELCLKLADALRKDVGKLTKDKAERCVKNAGAAK